MFVVLTGAPDVGRRLAGPALQTEALWSITWGLGVPDHFPDGPADIAAYADQTWIVNSRNTADETAARTLASLPVARLPLSEPKAVLTAYAVPRRGRATWPPLRVALDRMRPAPGPELPRPQWPRPDAGP